MDMVVGKYPTIPTLLSDNNFIVYSTYLEVVLAMGTNGDESRNLKSSGNR